MAAASLVRLTLCSTTDIAFLPRSSPRHKQPHLHQQQLQVKLSQHAAIGNTSAMESATMLELNACNSIHNLASAISALLVFQSSTDSASSKHLRHRPHQHLPIPINPTPTSRTPINPTNLLPPQLYRIARSQTQQIPHIVWPVYPATRS